MKISSNLRFVLDHPWRFIQRVIRGFLANQGFLLAGAVAYYTLLSIVPMFALILDSDDPARDVFNTAVALANLAASTHQVLSVELT